MTVAAIAVAIAPTMIAQRRAAAPAPKTSTAATCVSEVGSGVSTKRRFCDVLVAEKGAGSVLIPVPAHRGTSTLRFDLHNRFTVPPSNQTTAAQSFARHVAVVAVVSQTGEVIDRATATAEFRRPADLFDLIAGAGPGGVKAIGPGRGESYTITVPANVTAVGLIGLWLDETTSRGRQIFNTPGRPVALVSGIKVEYTPAR